MVEKKYETRSRFIEGQGHLVEEVEVGASLKPGQVVIPAGQDPAAKKMITAADVSPELARQVLEQAGLVVVPLNFLNPEQLQELGLAPSGTGEQKPVTIPADPAVKAGKMSAEQLIGLVKEADSFDKLNALMADESRKTVIAAAEQRAEELKAQGAK